MSHLVILVASRGEKTQLGISCSRICSFLPLAHHRFWILTQSRSSIYPHQKEHKGVERQLIHSFSDKTAGPPNAGPASTTLHRTTGATSLPFLDHHPGTMQFQGFGANWWIFFIFSAEVSLVLQIWELLLGRVWTDLGGLLLFVCEC